MGMGVGVGVRMKVRGVHGEILCNSMLVSLPF